MCKNRTHNFIHNLQRKLATYTNEFYINFILSRIQEE